MFEKQSLDRALEALRHLSDPQPPWEEVLRGASALFGTDGAVLIVHRQGRVDMQQVGADAAAVRDYAQHFHAQDVLLSPGMTAPVGSWLDTQDILTSRQRERSSYYNDFMCRHRMRQLGAVVLSRESPTHWVSLGLQRERVDTRLGERMTGGTVPATCMSSTRGSMPGAGLPNNGCWQPSSCSKAWRRPSCSCPPKGR